MKFIKPFRVGDTVEVKTGTFKGINIIQEINVQHTDDGYYVEYSSNRGAWIDHDDCELVSECSPESMEKLHEDWMKEYGEEL